MLIERDDHSWVLNIRASFTAFEQEVHLHYSDSAYTSPEEFNQLVIDYVTDHLLILVNEEDTASLSHAIVKLGHETNVIFAVEGIPSTIRTIKVMNTTFQDVYHSRSALIVLKEGMMKDQFVLNKENQYTATLAVTENYFTLYEETHRFQPLASLLYWGIASLLMAGGVIVFLRTTQVNKTE